MAMRTDEAAVQVMRERGSKLVWYGNMDITDEIAERAGYRRMHPINRGATVMSQIARSDKFEKHGAIEHLGHHHPVYKIKGEQI